MQEILSAKWLAEQTNFKMWLLHNQRKWEEKEEMVDCQKL